MSCMISLLKPKKELKLSNNKIELSNEQINMIKMKNGMLNVMIEKPLAKRNNCNKSNIYEAKIKKLKKYYKVLL